MNRYSLAVGAVAVAAYFVISVVFELRNPDSTKLAVALTLGALIAYRVLKKLMHYQDE